MLLHRAINRGLATYTRASAANEPLLFIPGPVESTPEVAAAANMPPLNHIGALVLESFSSALKGIRSAWNGEEGSQPFVLAGSGTLAMETSLHNLVEPGDRVLVLAQGYFGERFAHLARRIPNVDVELYHSPVGEAPRANDATLRLQRAKDEGKPFRAVFCTHVDTSVGVRAPIRDICQAAKFFGAYSVVDGVAGAFGETFDMQDVGADVYFTGSQKVLGVPAGVALQLVSPRGMERRSQLKNDPIVSYVDWNTWLPVMQAYEEQRPSYYATPSTSLIPALATSIAQAAPKSTIQAHARAARAMRASLEQLGLHRLATDEIDACNVLTAFYLPSGVAPPQYLAAVKKQGVQLAGPLLPEKSYVRLGHMGLRTVTDPEMMLKAVNAIESALYELSPEHVPCKGMAAEKFSLAFNA